MERDFHGKRQSPLSLIILGVDYGKAELTGMLFPISSSNILITPYRTGAAESYPVGLTLVKSLPTPWKAHSLNHGYPLFIQIVASKRGRFGSDACPTVPEWWFLNSNSLDSTLNAQNFLPVPYLHSHPSSTNLLFLSSFCFGS